MLDSEQKYIHPNGSFFGEQTHPFDIALLFHPLRTNIPYTDLLIQPSICIKKPRCSMISRAAIGFQLRAEQLFFSDVVLDKFEKFIDHED